MGAPTIYRWDDTDAPVLNGLAGSGWNMLKKCLVEGYGTKLPAGWSMLFEDVNLEIGVIQGNAVTGTGAIFQVNDNGVDVENYSGRSMKVSGFESMTDPITGSGQWGNLANVAFRKSSAIDGTSRAWVIIADDRAVYCFFANQQPSGAIAATGEVITGYFFGDGVPYLATDTHFAVIIGGIYNGYGSFGIVSTFATAIYGYHAMWRDMDLGNHGGQFAVITNGAMGVYGMGSLLSLPYPWYGHTVIARPLINNGVANTVRGELPGLHAPCHNVPFDNLEIVSIDGVDYMAMGVYEVNRYGQVLIDITAGFRP